MRWTSTRTINAAPSLVFATISDPAEFQRAVGADPNVEFLTEQRTGVGTRFRASRINRGKRMSFDQEVTRFVPGKLVRMVNETHGVLWDSTFEVQVSAGTSIVSLLMNAQTSRLLRRLMMRLIKPMVQRALDKDMDKLKAYLEQLGPKTSS